MSDKLFQNNLFDAIFVQVVCLGARATVQASYWLLTDKDRDQSHAAVHDISGEGTVTNGGCIRVLQSSSANHNFTIALNPPVTLAIALTIFHLITYIF